VLLRYKGSREVLEGTIEELIDSSTDEDNERTVMEKRAAKNETVSEKVKRQAEIPDDPPQDNTKADVCESKVEVTTPFWASNSNGKVRAIVNNDQFEQAIHQEICTKPSTLRCNRDCSCEQKYKWHRLLSYDPNNDCSGIFMDWFLFPSCCTCRATLGLLTSCNPLAGVPVSQDTVIQYWALTEAATVIELLYLFIR